MPAGPSRPSETSAEQLLLYTDPPGRVQDFGLIPGNNSPAILPLDSQSQVNFDLGRFSRRAGVSVLRQSSAGGEQQECIASGLDVVHAENLNLLSCQGQGNSNRAGGSVAFRIADDFADKPLTGMSDK